MFSLERDRLEKWNESKCRKMLGSPDKNIQ